MKIDFEQIRRDAEARALESGVEAAYQHAFANGLEVGSLRGIIEMLQAKLHYLASDAVPHHPQRGTETADELATEIMVDLERGEVCYDAVFDALTDPSNNVIDLRRYKMCDGSVWDVKLVLVAECKQRAEDEVIENPEDDWPFGSCAMRENE